MRIEELKVHFPTSQSRNAPMVKAVDGVTFDVPRNTIVGLVGESGSGKTTTGRALLRLFAPTAGRILFDGQDITNLSEKQMLPWRRRMQIVFQDPYASLNPRMTVSEILGEALDTHKLAQNRRAARIGELLERVGLNADHARRYPHEFSGGQRQRIGIARALAVEPDFIVADEPVSALDVSVQAQVLNLLQDLQRDLGLTMLFVAHDLAVVDYLCDEVVVMYLGRVMERGPTSEVYARPRHLYSRPAVGRAGAGPARAALAHPAQGRHSQPGQPAVGLRVPHPLSARDRGLRRAAAAGGQCRPGASCGLYPPRRPRAGGLDCAPIQDPSHEEQHPRHRFPDTQPARRPGVTERKVADAILDNIIWSASATVDQLAAKASVSIATISRFARTVGCEDTRDLKMKLAQASTVGSRFLDPTAPAEESTFYARIYADIESTLRAHLPTFTEQLFGQATAIAHEARMIYVFGMGGASAVLAQEVQSRLVRLGYPIAVYTDAVLLRMVAATLDERDAVLILSASGLTPEILGAARIVKQYRARIVAITDATSPLAEMADVVLPIRTDETDFIYKPSASRYAMMLAIDLLATELAMLHQEENRERLRRIKLALDGYRGGPNRLPLGD